jgi:hypothetical protein
MRLKRFNLSDYHLFNTGSMDMDTFNLNSREGQSIRDLFRRAV